jgi:hypothetical protein
MQTIEVHISITRPEPSDEGEESGLIFSYEFELDGTAHRIGFHAPTDEEDFVDWDQIMVAAKRRFENYLHEDLAREDAACSFIEPPQPE